MCQLSNGNSVSSLWLEKMEKICDKTYDCLNTHLDEPECSDTVELRSGRIVSVNDICDGDCDDDCEDEANCRGFSYGMYCQKTDIISGKFNSHHYVHPHEVCNGIKDCDNGEDESNCTVLSENIVSCTHSKTDKLVPIHNFTRCARFAGGRRGSKTYCSNITLSQSNCTDPAKVATVCKVKGFSTDISQYLICPGFLDRNVTACDDRIDAQCFDPSISCTNLHKHRFCDGIHDCEDGSDETNSICKSTTEGTCKRTVGNLTLRAQELEIPLAWLRDGVKDCVDGSDERAEWPICGTGSIQRFKARNTTCENVYICHSGEPGFVELSDLCDGIETCGNENEVCSLSRKIERLETNVLTFDTGLTKKISFCMDGLRESLNNSHNLSCVTEQFIFPDHEFYGVNTKTKLILPQHPQDCDQMHGEQYVYTSCTGKCTNSVCPLKTIPQYEVCPSQLPKRVGTLANNKYLAFFTVSRENTYTNRYFVCKDKQKCLDYSKVCDLVKDCEDYSDETNCTNHFKCKSSGLLIPKSSECDGKFDCWDMSDECNNRCHEQILDGGILKVLSWLIGGVAVVANGIILIRHTIGLRKSKNAVVLVNKSLMILICFGDFLTGSYLITISVYDSIIYQERYCESQIEWISSTGCSIIGVFSTIGSQISLFSMTGLSIVRIYVIWTSKSRQSSSTINMKSTLAIVGTVLLIILASVAIAIIPIMDGFEEFFVNGIKFSDKLNIFIGTTRKETVLNVIGAYYGRISNKEKLSWKTVIAMIREMFSHDFDYQDHTKMVKKVHFYGNDGVCLFKYFVDGDDPQKKFVWSILAVNFSCFLSISVSYLLIYLITRQSSSATGNQSESKRMNSMNRKIAFIITTDFFCWIPFIIVCALHSFEVLDATFWYALFSMVILPLNSVINPFLYDSFLTGGIRKRVRGVFSFLTNFSVFSMNQIHDGTEGEGQANAMEMQQIRE